MRRVAILGSTGSIGRSSIEVLREMRSTHSVCALVAARNGADILLQAREFRPEIVGLADESALREIEQPLRREGISAVGGPDAAVEAIRATRPDIVLAGITGAAGLPSSLEAVRLGSTLALANKEALVMAGHLIARECARSGARLIPVDSEHSAIFQSLHEEPPERVRRLFLTASGGPFVDLPASRFASVTREQALSHPTWDMGERITIDSASLMNKALEIVEARQLFDVPPDRIAVLVHRQSIVHSMVEFKDGSMIAQLGKPSMTVPIRVALAWPERAETDRSYFDLEAFSNLTFEEPDRRRFPALDIGYRVARDLGLAGAVMNAANEVAVCAFLSGRLGFDRIPMAVEHALEKLDNRAAPELEEILEADRWARMETERWIPS